MSDVVIFAFYGPGVVGFCVFLRLGISVGGDKECEVECEEDSDHNLVL